MNPPEIDALKALNERVAGMDDLLFPNPIESRNVFVIGAPRSGTTLVCQIMAALLDIGYINNVAAAFWNAPAFGVEFAQRFVTDRKFFGKSNYGQTSAPSEPHEFGAFWRGRLGYDDMIQKLELVEFAPLIRSLDQIATAWDNRRVFYKVFQLTWHLAEFHQKKPNSKWIWVKRDFESNVQSLLKLATQRKQKWTSSTPLQAIREFDDAPDWKRACAQITYLESWLTQQLEQIPADCQLQIQLDQLVSQPEPIIRSVADFLGLSFDSESLSEIKNALTPPKPIQNEYSERIGQFSLALES